MKYKDEIISFEYPDDFKLIRAKRKWGQYDLKKKIAQNTTIIIIHVLSNEYVNTIKATIQTPSPDEFSKIEYFDSVAFGEKTGIGHSATLYDRLSNFYEKLYRYLFSIPTGGIYVEISSNQDFEIGIYTKFLESIEIKD